MTELSELIKMLSERFHDENDISDITYTLLQFNKEFKDTFLNLIFPDIKSEEIIYFQREMSENDSRPDFIIFCSQHKYLIEIKKDDKNHHFEQYINTFPDYKRAYITNYKLDSEKEFYKDKYVFLTWHEIFDNLIIINRSLKNNVIEGYIQYLKYVLNFTEITDMRFDNLTNLAQFNAFVTEIIKNNSNGLISPNTRPNDGYSSTWSGSSFILKNKDGDKTISPWFGVYYGDNDTKIKISIDIKNCHFLEKYKAEIYDEIKKSDYSECIFYNNTEIQAILRDNWFNKLQTEESISNQKQILRTFFETVIDILTKFLEQK